MGILVKIQGPQEPVVDLAYAKKFIRVDTTADDELLTTLLRAAEQRLDGRDGILGRALGPQTWEYQLLGWPVNNRITIPLPPLIAVTSITYTDGQGVPQTLATDQYRVVGEGSATSYILPENSIVWPDTFVGFDDAVRIRFDAGYRGDQSPENMTVLETIRTAIVLMARSWYDNSGQEDIPEVVNSLVSPHKVDRLGRA